MSFATLIEQLPAFSDLKIGERLLLAILVWHCGENGHCWPSIEKLTRELGGDKKTTFRLLRSLEVKGYVVRGKKERNRNTYTLLTGDKNGTTENVTSDKKGSSQIVPERCQNGVNLLKKKEKKEKRVRTRLPLLKKIEDLEEALGKMDIEKCRAKWELEGVDVEAVVRNMRKFVLTGDAKKPFPNPANWRDFDRALDDSCERWLQRYSQKGVSQTDTTSPELKNPLWAEIKTLGLEKRHDLSIRAREHIRKNVLCPNDRNPPDSLIRQHMIKIYEAQKARAP